MSGYTSLDPPPAAAVSELYESFRQVTYAWPEKVAIVDHDGISHSYATLLSAVDAAADTLSDRVLPDEAVGLAVDDALAFCSIYLAAAKVGLLIVLLDSRLPEEEIRRTRARFDLGWMAVDARDPASGGRSSFELLELQDRDRCRAVSRWEPADFVVHCTSGSTGEPKGIVMSQRAIAARVSLWSSEIALKPADIVLCALPLSHCHGIDVLALPSLLSGATVVFARGGQLTGRGLARRVASHRVTVMSALPLMYELLVAARGIPATSLETLRLVISGSAPLAPRTQERFAELFSIPVRQVYGLSEIGVICFDKQYVGGGSIGLPVAGIEWRLDPVAGSLKTDAGRDGAQGGGLHELFVRGPALARGYYKDADATDSMFENGWLRTHDLIDPSDHGWSVRGRRSGFINVGGSKVSPLDVEAALRECPGVDEAAVVGLPDSKGFGGGQVVVALVVPGDGFALSTVQREVKEHLLPHQVPQRFYTISALPRTPLGKTDYATVEKTCRGAGDAA